MRLDARSYVEDKVVELKNRVKALDCAAPCLVIFKIGDNPSSNKYVDNKIKKCREVGITPILQCFPEDAEQERIEEELIAMGTDPMVTGILVQLPIPKHLNEKRLLDLIPKEKDIDGFGVENTGLLALGEKGNLPCTPKGIMNLLDYYGYNLEGKNVLIINRSNIVGKPLAHLMLERNATVTIAHSRTRNIDCLIAMNEIIITGVGIKDFLTAEKIGYDKTIIDVSINFNEFGKMCGDIRKEDYEELDIRNCKYSPVPFGVGQTTVMALIEQLVEIKENK